MPERKYKQLWVVEEPKEGSGRDKGYWTKIGVAFENKDGSFSLHLSALPVNGKLQMRDPLPKDHAVAA